MHPSSKLIQECASGTEEALKNFFETYALEIYNFPIKVFHLDEDSASDFFLYAYQRLKDGSRFRSYQNRSSFRTWFYTVLRNLVIDWMRTIREVTTVNMNSKNNTGDLEFDFIANTPDPRSLQKEECINIQKSLDKISIEMRALFKLSYIYYLELEQDELLYLCQRTNKTPNEFLEKILELRNKLSYKEVKNLSSEDKITALYLSIVDLGNKKEQIQKKLERENLNDINPFIEMEAIEHSLNKKKKQKERLLQKKKTSHFIVRTPYKYVAEILGISEGNISVQMMRIIERLRETTVA